MQQTITSQDAPHTRLPTFDVRHLQRMLTLLKGGSIGFDPNRNPLTATKGALVEYIRANFQADAIDQAHRDAVAGYGPSKRGKRGSAKSAAIEPSMSLQSAAAAYSAQIMASPVMQLATAPQPAPAPAPAHVPAPQPAQVATPVHQPGNVNDALSALFGSMVQAQIAAAVAGIKADLDKVAKEAAEAASNGFTLVKVQQPGMIEPVNVGLQHKQFPTLLKMSQATTVSGHRLNVWLYGPAGTGKTTAAEKVAEALNLPFRYNGALDTRYDLLGFRTANGDTVRTPFRDAWEHGGVYLFDEIDASNPSALLALNGALANGLAAFPDGMIPRHKDCIILAGANTVGSGATVEYVGRFKQDASLTDRFVYLAWPIDEALESALCVNKEWLRRVRKVRAQSKTVKNYMVTPRATIFGEALLNAGIDMETVEAATLRKGMADDVWRTVSL